MTVVFMIVISEKSSGQAELPPSSGIAYKPATSILYGSDVIINDQPTQNQRDVCLSVAYNGWLYAGYSYSDGYNNKWMILLSQDDGITWNVIRDQELNTNWFVQAFDIVVTGQSEADLRIIVGRILENDKSSSSNMIVSQLDGNTGVTLNTLVSETITLPEKYLDIAVASDYLFPAENASPYSVGVLYSRFSSSSDTIRFLSSSNGGVSIDGNQVVATLGYYSRNVSLAYGRSAAYYNGRYFAAWEARSSTSSDLGRIFTAHSNPYFNSSFTTPVRLDDMIGSTAEFARNPSIACQFGDVDNGLGNLTEVVLFDRAYNGNTDDFDIVGCYNKEAATTDSWSIFGMYAGINSSDIQPDINYDPGYGNFLATYFNKTDLKLRYLVKSYDMPDPYFWGVITDRYNDGINLVNPYPKVEINLVYMKVAHVWNAEIAAGGQSMFDAEYSVVGTKETAPFNSSVTVFPNPVTTKAVFSVKTEEPGIINLQLLSLQGKQIMEVVNGNYPAGINNFEINVGNLPESVYFYRAIIGQKISCGQLIIEK